MSQLQFNSENRGEITTMSGINNGLDVRNLQLRHQLAVNNQSNLGKVNNGQTAAKKESFSALMEKRMTEENLKFSKHAQMRIEERGINVSDKLLNDLDNAVERARKKGAKDTVIIGTEGNFLVNIPNNTVVTTMTQKEMKENVFTNIDSVILI